MTVTVTICRMENGSDARDYQMNHIVLALCISDTIFWMTDGQHDSFQQPSPILMEKNFHSKFKLNWCFRFCDFWPDIYNLRNHIVCEKKQISMSFTLLSLGTVVWFWPSRRIRSSPWLNRNYLAKICIFLQIMFRIIVCLFDIFALTPFFCCWKVAANWGESQVHGTKLPNSKVQPCH